MASLDRRLNPLYAIKECSSCGNLHTKDCGCSKGSLEDKILVPIPDSYQRPLKIENFCLNCGNPVHGLYCRQCALIRKTLEEVFQDFQDTSKSSDDDTNFVNQEPFVVKQGPGVNTSQSPPHIDHHCCYECGDSLDDIFCQRCTCESCGKGAHYGYNCPPQVLIISKPEPCNNQTINEFPQTLPSVHPTSYSGDENSFTYDSKPNFVDDSPNVFNPPPQPPMYSCEFCGNDARYGHYCTPQVPFIYPKLCYNQDFNFPQDFHDFQQQYLCCENCGGPHETYQCQPMNEDYYHEQNSCYDYNSFGFDQFQPPQHTGNHPIFNDQNDFLISQNKLMEQLTSIRDIVGQYIQNKVKEKRIEEEQAAKDRYWKIHVCYDDDDNEESSIPLKYIIIFELPPCVAITPVLFTEEPVDSLIMEDGNLNTILETESDELIKSSVEDLVQILSESEDSFEGECYLPPYDDSSKNHDLTFSNPLFDIDEDFTSSDESFSEEDVPNENFRIFSNPLFDLDEEITSTKVDQIDDEIDYLLDEFVGELTLLKSIPPEIDDVNLDPKGDILFLESLLYDNSSPHPPEEFNSKNPTESFSPSPIPIEDSDSLMEEIDIFLDGDDSIPPGIGSDDYDSEDDDNSTSLPEFESFHVDYPDLGDSTIDVVEDIPVDVPNILPTYPALQLDFDFIPSYNDLGSDLDNSSLSGDRNKIYDSGICIEVESTRFHSTRSPVINTLLPFSSENKDKVFNHGVLAYKEKAPSSPSHQGFKAAKLFHQKSPMLISGDNTPNLGVRHPHFYPP
ncbi:hypothetical protein Tco_0439456 [Tanacetum coccineum]